MIDFSKEHKTLLSRLAKSPNGIEARADLLRCNCLWAEENIKGNKNTWQNANLIREVLQYGPLLLETGEMSMYDLVYKTCDRIKRTIFSHPRLSVKILELEREALYRIEAETAASYPSKSSRIDTTKHRTANLDDRFILIETKTESAWDSVFEL